MDKELTKALVEQMPVFSDTHDIWPTAFMSKQDRKRRLAREHNDAYVACKQAPFPFELTDQPPRGSEG